jgi:hypothetical protein
MQKYRISALGLSQYKSNNEIQGRLKEEQLFPFLVKFLILESTAVIICTTCILENSMFYLQNIFFAL